MSETFHTSSHSEHKTWHRSTRIHWSKFGIRLLGAFSIVHRTREKREGDDLAARWSRKGMYPGKAEGFVKEHRLVPRNHIRTGYVSL